MTVIGNGHHDIQSGSHIRVTSMGDGIIWTNIGTDKKITCDPLSRADKYTIRHPSIRFEQPVKEVRIRIYPYDTDYDQKYLDATYEPRSDFLKANLPPVSGSHPYMKSICTRPGEKELFAVDVKAKFMDTVTENGGGFLGKIQDLEKSVSRLVKQKLRSRITFESKWLGGGIERVTSHSANFPKREDSLKESIPEPPYVKFSWRDLNPINYIGGMIMK